MEPYEHNLNALFNQLGLDDSDQAIEKFISQHKPVTCGLLYEAGFWSKSQSTFLKEAIEEDAEWSIVVDQLDTMLR